MLEFQKFINKIESLRRQYQLINKLIDVKKENGESCNHLIVESNSLYSQIYDLIENQPQIQYVVSFDYKDWLPDIETLLAEDYDLEKDIKFLNQITDFDDDYIDNIRIISVDTTCSYD